MVCFLMDIGNSTVVTAVLREGQLGCIRRYATNKFLTVFKKIRLEDYDRVIISSVVPQLDQHFLDVENVFLVTCDKIPILTLDVDKPEQVGADRLVNALGAYQMVENRPVLVVDSGTATTFCLVDTKGVYMGGAIYPGMKIASIALRDHTAKIPLILVSPQENLIGKTTREAVQVGLYHGSIHMINGMIAAYRERSPDLYVVGTGKGLSVLASRLSLDFYDPQLILKGLSLIAKAL